MKTLTYLPVNWVNGLKLTSKHFFANQYSQTEALNRELRHSTSATMCTSSIKRRSRRSGSSLKPSA